MPRRGGQKERPTAQDGGMHWSHDLSGAAHVEGPKRSRVSLDPQRAQTGASSRCGPLWSPNRCQRPPTRSVSPSRSGALADDHVCSVEAASARPTILSHVSRPRLTSDGAAAGLASAILKTAPGPRASGTSETRFRHVCQQSRPDDKPDRLPAGRPGRRRSQIAGSDGFCESRRRHR